MKNKLINGLINAGIKSNNIYVDLLVQPLASNSAFGLEFLNAVGRIMINWPGIHTMCGLSNISYGLPKRDFLNQILLTMAISRGLDGAIINPLDKQMMANIIAAEAIAGKDEYCMKYIKAYREKKLEFGEIYSSISSS